MRQFSQTYLVSLLIRLSFVAVSLAFPGCTIVNYYRQAVGGHLSLMLSTEPVNELLTTSNTPYALKAKLQTAQKARDFARTQLHLPVGDAFSEYAELNRPWVLVNLVAAPEFSLQAHQWCYPVIGCQAYRGYYNVDDARHEQRQFVEKSFDTFIGGVTAYSTLGWFDDPLHTGFVNLGNDRMVALMFHELAHQVVYINEDTAFNESFATAVELEGLRLWLKQDGNTAGFKRALARLKQRNQTLTLVEETTSRLRNLYARQGVMSRARMREKKAELLEKLREDYMALSESWAEPGPFGANPGPLNNANLALFSQYNQHVPAFRQLFLESGQRFADFYNAVEALSQSDQETRQRALNDLSKRFDEHL